MVINKMLQTNVLLVDCVKNLTQKKPVYIEYKLILPPPPFYLKVNFLTVAEFLKSLPEFALDIPILGEYITSEMDKRAHSGCHGVNNSVC